MRTRTFVSVVASGLAAVLLLSSCGDSGEDPDQGSPATTTSATSETSADQSDWRSVDACALLSADEVGVYLGQAGSEPSPSDENGRPTCSWTGDGSDRVKLMVWEPPAPDIIADPGKRTVDVAGHPGYVTTETSSSCLLEADAGPAFLSMDVFSSQAGEDVCQQVAGSLATVVETLGW